MNRTSEKKQQKSEFFDKAKPTQISFAQGSRLGHTVDGRTPASVDMVKILLFTGFHTCRVVSRISEPSTISWIKSPKFSSKGFWVRFFLPRKVK